MVITNHLQPAYVSRFLQHSHRNGEPSHPSKPPAHQRVATNATTKVSQSQNH